MADSISILIRSILQSPNAGDIEKVKRQIQASLGNISINPNVSGGKGIKLLDQTEIDRYLQKMNNAITRLQIGKDKVFVNDNIKNELSKLQGMLNGLNTSSTSNSIKQINGQFDTLRTKVLQVSNEFKNVNKDGYSFSQMLELAIKKISIWGISTVVVYSSIRKIKESFDFIREQSKTFTNLQMEMTNTNLVFKDIVQTANEYATAMSNTTNNVMKAISVFGTYTATMDEVLEKSKAAIIMSNITGDGILQTSDDLMGTLAQFKLGAEDAMHVVDVIAGTSRNLSLDFPKAISEISTGIRTVGSVALESKVPLELLSSMIGTLAEKTRKSGSEISNGLSCEPLVA